MLVELPPELEFGEGGAGFEGKGEGELVGAEAGGEEKGVKMEGVVEASMGGAGADEGVPDIGGGVGDGAEEEEGEVEEAKGEVGEGGGGEEGG